MCLLPTQRGRLQKPARTESVGLAGAGRALLDVQRNRTVWASQQQYGVLQSCLPEITTWAHSESFQAFQAASGCFSTFDVCLDLMEMGWIEMS